MSRQLKPVAVVTPLHRAEVSVDEEISRRHLLHHLGAYDRFLVVPQSLGIDWPGFGVRRFDDAYFRSPQTYSALLVSHAFYEAFRDYEYILIYQLDALVFSDQLLAWCRKGFDYIGAPWWPCDYTPHIVRPKVGNGGFSLRNVQSCLRVLESPALGRTYWVDPDAYWERLRAGMSGVQRLANLPRKYLKRLHAFNNMKRALGHTLRYPDLIVEDDFWSTAATRLDPAFRVAPVEQAVRFAFEAEPRMCYRMIGETLPFGCHAWDRVDRAFYAPFLETADV